MKGGNRGHQGVYAEEKQKGGVYPPTVTDDSDSLSVVLVEYTVQGRTHTQHELPPVLTTWAKWLKRLLAIVGYPAFDLVPPHTIKIADRLLLYVVIEDNRQPQCGRYDFGGLPRTRQRAGDEDIGGNLTSCHESVPQ